MLPQTNKQTLMTDIESCIGLHQIRQMYNNLILGLFCVSRWISSYDEEVYMIINMKIVLVLRLAGW